MIKISIIGFGSIGKFVFKKLSEKNIKIQSLICKPGREEIAKKAFGSGIEIKNDIDELDNLPDLILDCAGHDALKMFAAKALIKGINFITLSSGALSDEPERAPLDKVIKFMPLIRAFAANIFKAS